MKADILYDAMGEIREDLIAEAQTVSRSHGKRVLQNLIAACLTVFLLAVPVSAEVNNGYISNLLAPLYGGAQTELVEDTGVPIGSEVTVNGYTLSADAVIGDRYNIAVVYTLRREDGGELPEGLRFKNPGSAFLATGGSGHGIIRQTVSADGRSLEIVEEWSSSGRLFLFRRRASVVFSDLEIWDGETDTAALWQKGVWKLDFTIRYPDTTRKLSIDDLEVTNSEGDQFTVHRVQISPFGVRVRLTVPNPNYGKPPLAEDASEAEIRSRSPAQFAFALRLTDGTVMEVSGGTISGGSMEDQTHRGVFTGLFERPVLLEEIDALIFCGTEVPLTN